MEGASRATMVELPKQVHLQKDVGAKGMLVVCVKQNGELGRLLQAARERERKLRKTVNKKRQNCGLRIVMN
jgi:predicted regulator of Ras-like GTPase activity (Roadblock/LC7/MglB family)